MSDLLRLLRLYRPYARWMLSGIALSSTVVIANVGLLALAGWFIASMALAGIGGPGVEYFAPAAGIRALAILRTGGRYGERLVTHEATFRLIARLRVWFYEHLEPLAPARLQHYRGGDLLSRIRADIDSLDNLYLSLIVPSIAALISVVAMVAFLFLFSHPVALADGAGLLFVGVALPLLARRFGSAPGCRAVALRSDLRAAVSDTVRGLGELVVCRAFARQRATVSRLASELVAAGRRQAILGAASSALSGLGAHLTMWLALVLAIPLVAGHALPGPDLAMIALFVLASFEAVAALPLAFGTLGETLAAAGRIFEIVDAAPAVTEPAIAAAALTRFDLRIEGLRMRYANDAPWALDGVDLIVPQGGSLGVVGPSGSGKTSLLNVLLRFWDYQEGCVAVGGVSLRALGGDSMRGLCAVVSQQTHLFNTSVRENLRLARPDAGEAELHAALRDAALLDEVLVMPKGLDTIVGETGTRLSGGQARRLALARAFLKDAPLLFLDEPTEGLDAASEHLVLQAVATLMRDRTTVLITHHRQALRLVDDAVKLECGRCRMPP